MNWKLLSAVLPACIALQLAVLPIHASAQEQFGGVGGVTRDSATKQPVAQVRVTAHNLAKGTDYVAVSGSDGTFTMAELEPGPYQVAAVRAGFIKSTANVEVSVPGAYRVDFLLASEHQPALEAAPPAEPSMSAMAEELSEMKERIAQLETALRARTAPATSAPTTTIATASVPVPAPASKLADALASPSAAAIPQEALQSPEATPGVDNFTPFAFGDFTWLNGNPRNKDTVLDTKFFTPEIRFDTHFMEDFNQPKDHTMGGATESFRSGEFQVEQISVGGDFHWQNVRGRILTMNGLFASTTPRNDASAGVGQWDVRGAYKYVSEAYGGYHFNVNHGLNVDAGIFVSYIGLFSYYNFDNWTYQPSFVSSNTPWFFNGLRIQWYPTNKLKIEPWIINGWQSYNKFNGHMGLGGQILYRPHEWLSLVFNNYGNGTDTLGVPGRSRLHTDDSVEVRYYNKPEKQTGIDKMAFSFTADAGCEYGGGVTCHGGKAGPKQAFLGWMLYDRLWWDKDRYALTLGGGQMNNPGRYLTLLPPINGADAISGSPYFPANPGSKAHMWDTTLNFQWMPKQYITWWGEAGYRHSDVPYWTGRQGITPPGGNTGFPAQFVCTNGVTSVASPDGTCGAGTSLWQPDMRRGQGVVSAGVMVKF
jgi:Putative beta-barrel porin-2, OmpL-like. bbp2/Carboxypeptidase regulatory-like domain